MLNSSGRLVWSEPQRPAQAGADYTVYAPVREALRTNKPITSNLFEVNPQQKSTLFLVIPVQKDGRTSGYAGGEIDPTGSALLRVIREAAVGNTGYVEVVDGNGRILASTRPHDILTQSDHGGFLADAIRMKQQKVGACHSCHETREPPQKEIMAFSPLSTAAWGVSIRQSESEALTPVRKMEIRLMLFGFLLLAVTIILAWGISQSVISPVQALRTSAERIASGDLVEPVAHTGTDEIGKLGRTLDEMRLRLKDSLEEIGRMNRDLEQRVVERTKEVRFLYDELKRKEEARGELIQKILSAQEEERRRIARELHDELSQNLTAVLLSLDSAASSRETVRALVVRAIDSIHRLIFDLRPAVLDDLGLAAAIKWYAEERLATRGIHLHFEPDPDWKRIDQQIESALFRIAQETISNVLRHSGAENVIIDLAQGDDSVILEIDDDGKGFVYEEFREPINSSRGLGLLGMKERAELLNGILEIDTAPDEGTRIVAKFPVGRIKENGQD